MLFLMLGRLGRICGKIELTFLDGRGKVREIVNEAVFDGV